MVPLRQVADLVETRSPQIIKRQDLQRRIGIYANAEGRPSGDVGSDVQKVADALQLPAGYRLAADIVQRLRAVKAPPSWLRMIEECVELDEADASRVFGEALPPGLRLMA